MAWKRSLSCEIILGFGLCFLIQGCATVNVANIGEQGYQKADDELRMFKRAEEFAEVIDATNSIYSDLALDQYLNDLAKSLLSQEVKDSGISIRIKVIKDPDFNAFTFGNGIMYIHTGILAACENEAQLVSLMGHEIGHVLHRHALKEFRSTINKTAFISALYGFGLAGTVVQLGTISTISGYSQQQEYEADRVSFEILRDHGYDVRESVKLFQILEEHLKSEEIKMPYFFSTHPQVKARIVSFQDLIAKEQMPGQNRIIDSDKFQVLTKAVRVLNMELLLSKGYFKTAEKFINAYIKQYPQDFDGYFWKGELFRQRSDGDKPKNTRLKDADWKIALANYDLALGKKSETALAWKGKGLVYQKMGQTKDAGDAFRHYLDIDPQAKDKAYIERYLKKE
ncbi:MAG: M48 family metalloprotease [Candidatus Omnitrophica bacterium]|nr:M48 family metalloprotease [Candidatus Omnitrophota bacterium]